MSLCLPFQTSKCFIHKCLWFLTKCICFLSKCIYFFSYAFHLDVYAFIEMHMLSIKMHMLLLRCILHAFHQNAYDSSKNHYVFHQNVCFFWDSYALRQIKYPLFHIHALQIQEFSSLLQVLKCCLSRARLDPSLVPII